ncbi:MAG: hypothetical protein J0L64_03775 [Acidobacteria bacterium]|nr:hypothetical protein [Acidobacteriota bacterium]
MRALRPVWLAFLWFLVSGIFFEAAAQAVPGFRIRYTCNEGRFKVRYGGKNGAWHYCYDKTYYTDKTIPPDIRAFFDNMDAKLAEVDAKFSTPAHQQQVADWKAKVEARRQSEDLQSAAYRGSSSLRGRPIPTAAAGGIEASAKPEAKPLAPETLKALAPGSPAADIVAALGEPPGKVSTGEQAESWTYVLTTGAFAKLRLEDGKLKSVELP